VKRNMRRWCHLCGAVFGSSNRTGRVAVTLMDNKDYSFFMFHKGCLAKNPAIGVGIVLGVIRKKPNAALPPSWGSYRRHP